MGRIVSRTQANGLYHWPVTTVSGTAGVNGLDQLTSSGGTSLTYDGRGNLAGRGAWGYAHDVEDHLTQITSPVNLTLRYDALGRVTSQIRRDGQVIAFVYDALGRVTALLLSSRPFRFRHASSAALRRSARLRSWGSRMRFLSRMADGVTSTSSSSAI